MDFAKKLVINKKTKIQLGILTEIEAVLRSAHIQFWLRGGWAIDFLLGQLTRSHSDIDLVVWQQDKIQLCHLFKQTGFVLVQDIGIQFDFAKKKQVISVVFITRNKNRLRVENIPDWYWLPDALTFPRQQLGDLWCHVLSP